MIFKQAFWILMAAALLAANPSHADDVDDRLASMPFIRVTADVEAGRAFNSKYGLSPELLTDAAELVLRRNRVSLISKPTDGLSFTPRFHIFLHVVHATNGISELAVYNLSIQVWRLYLTDVLKKRGDHHEMVQLYVESPVWTASHLNLSPPADLADLATEAVKDMADKFSLDWLRANPEWIQ